MREEQEDDEETCDSNKLLCVCVCVCVCVFLLCVRVESWKMKSF